MRLPGDPLAAPPEIQVPLSSDAAIAGLGYCPRSGKQGLEDARPLTCGAGVFTGAGGASHPRPLGGRADEDAWCVPARHRVPLGLKPGGNSAACGSVGEPGGHSAERHQQSHPRGTKPCVPALTGGTQSRQTLGDGS